MASILRPIGESPIVDTGGKNKKEIRLRVGQNQQEKLIRIANEQRKELRDSVPPHTPTVSAPENFEEALMDVLLFLTATGEYPQKTWNWDDVPREKVSKDSASAPIKDGIIAKTVPLATGPVIRVGTRRGLLQIRLDDSNTAIGDLVGWLSKNDLLDVLKE